MTCLGEPDEVQVVREGCEVSPFTWCEQVMGGEEDASGSMRVRLLLLFRGTCIWRRRRRCLDVGLNTWKEMGGHKLVQRIPGRQAQRVQGGFGSSDSLLFLFLAKTGRRHLLQPFIECLVSTARTERDIRLIDRPVDLDGDPELCTFIL